MRVRSGGTTPAFRRCLEESCLRSTPASHRTARARCELQSLWRNGSPSRLDRVAFPMDSSTTSRYSRGVCPPCICAEHAPGYKCVQVVLLRPWIFPLLKSNLQFLKRFIAFDP